MNHSPLFTQLSASLQDEAPCEGGAIPDLSGLSAPELGALWPAAYHQRNNFDSPARRALAAALLDYGRQQVSPLLDEADAVAVFRQLRAWDEAVQHLAWLAQPPAPALETELVRILHGEGERTFDDAYWAQHRYAALCLSEFAGEACRMRLQRAVAEHCANAPAALREFMLLPQLGFSNLLALALSQTAYYHPREQDAFRDPVRLLSEEPAYAALAQEILTQAAGRIDAIQQGQIPYVADGAFCVEDAHVIARMARVAAWRDEDWFGPLIERLLPGTAVAPGAAKSLPSQSLAVALGHAVEGVPTPEGVMALRRALDVVRHAGIQKKLARNLKPAERALALRPETALRLGDVLPAGKRAQSVQATCLEASFWLEGVFPAPVWREKLLGSPAYGALARTLIWARHRPGQPVCGFMPAARGDVLLQADGSPLTLEEEDRVALWHPLHFPASERAAWQARMTAQRIAQPFRQAFREHYFCGDDQPGFGAGTFAGYLLALRTLLGLAAREGWRIGGGWDEGLLLRGFGSFRAGFGVHARLYPGVAGWGESGDIQFWRQASRGWVAVSPGEVPAVIFSEVCRAVDLLVSRAGIAAAGDEPCDAEYHERHQRFLSETGRIGAMRRDALQQLFAPEIAAGKLSLEGNRVIVGGYAVNLTTARVTLNGAPVSLPAPEVAETPAVSWLPYDESLLKQICASVRMLLSSTY